MRTFTKPAITVADQLALLKERGLAINNESRATQFLEVVTLFRLSPYMRPFQHTGDTNHTFKTGSTLRQIVDIYRFDAAMRQLVMDAIERVEVAMRAGISNHMTPTYGTHWYMDKNHFKSNYDHERLLKVIHEKLDDERQQFAKDCQRINNNKKASEKEKQQHIDKRKRDNYARYYGATYNEPALLPCWAALEELSMGALSKLYQGIARDVDRKAIAKRFKLPHEVLGSWFHTLTFVRNCCAHHSRLWNRELAVPPELPKHKDWQLPDAISGQPGPKRRIFIVLTILAHFMEHISPDSQWRERLLNLLNRFPATPIKAMGFPPNWKRLPQWQCLNTVELQLEQLKTLKNGWLDGKGLAPDATQLDWLAAQFQQYFPNTLPKPYCYPTAEGGVQAEWSIGSHENSLDINLNNHEAYWHSLNLNTHEDYDKTLDMNQAASWQWLVDELQKQEQH